MERVSLMTNAMTRLLLCANCHSQALVIGAAMITQLLATLKWVGA